MFESSLTPEHDKRLHVGPEDRRGHTEVLAANDYVDSRLCTADAHGSNGFAWHGWALREAFLAGISYAERIYVLQNRDAI
jgi:hypothetical protein